MRRLETVELTVLCLIRKDGNYLLQDRLKEDWKGFTMPGGHVEAGESIVGAVIREVREETGLTVRNPRLCGVKQFPIEEGRYIVFLFRAEEFDGELISSEEGQMRWVNEADLPYLDTVDDFAELLQVMLDDGLNEFQYIVEGEEWRVVLK